MKLKVKNIVMSVLLVFSVFCFSACKDKKDKETELSAPIVNVIVENREFYVGDKLSDILISLTEGDTAGTVVWSNPNYELVLGDNNVSWKFTPTDTSVYEDKSGSVKISAVEPKLEPTVNVSITSEKVYAENKLSAVSLKTADGDTAGTLSWRDENVVIELGEHEYEWKFTPTDTETYKEIIGKIKITSVAQTLSSIEVKTSPTKTAYVAFDEFDDTGLVLNGIFDGGKVEEISEGWDISYISGDCVHGSDTKVVISYQEKTCDVVVTVSKYEIDKPIVDGTYVYNGQNQTAVLKQDSNSNLYTAETITEVNAGSYGVNVTLKDFVNYKWKDSATQTISVAFVIEEADHVLQKTNHTGVYDGLSHSVKVEGDKLTKVYYSLTPIDKSNYISGSEDIVSKVNATDTKVYFYAIAEENYKDYADFLTLKIDKATPKVETDYCFTIASDKNVNIPLNYVSVLDIEDESLDIASKIEFVYYTSYIDAQHNTKTTSAQGAASEGGAPKIAGEYVVVTKYLGNENYKVTETTSTLVVDEDNSLLLAHGTEDVFAWLKSDKTAYVEFAKDEINGLSQIVFDAKINGNISSGVLFKENDVYYALFDGSEDFYIIDVTSETLKLKNESGLVVKTLSKWVLPKYLGNYEKDTISTDTTTPNSSMTIYNDYGVLKFTFTYYQYDLDEVTVRPAVIDTGYVVYISKYEKLELYSDSTLEESYITIYNIPDGEEIEHININLPGREVISGEYAKV